MECLFAEITLKDLKVEKIMKKWMQVLVLTVLAGGCIALFQLVDESKPTIVINEVCNRNGTIATDDGYTGDDYIELYNATRQTVSLKGWYLSDDAEETDKQPLPDVDIEPKGFLVLYANGEGNDEKSLNFKISSDGETIFLSNPDGEIADQIYVPTLDMDHVYARKNDGGNEWAVLEESLGKSNKNAAEAPRVLLDTPVLSHKSGFYEDEFVLTMSAKRGEKIYYTTDGSVPTENSKLYKDGIVIKNINDQENVINGTSRVVADWKDYQLTEEKTDKANVIRAIAIGKDNQVSEVVTETYFVGLEEYKDMDVLSIVADPESLVGDNGIFVTGTAYDEWYLADKMSSDAVFEPNWTTNYELTNFWKKGRGAEVLSNIQLFENGKETLEQAAGVRVRGNYTRLLDKKSLQLTSRGVYSGKSVFDTQIFDGYDSHAVYVSAFLEKAYCMKLAERRSMGLQDTRECATFINGEYWYTSAFMEEFDELYFAQHYGVNPENVLLIKDTAAAMGEEYQYIYDDLLNYLRDESISQTEKCVYLYEQFDVQSIIDWLCFNLYIGNHDLTYKRNSILWRTIEPEDGPYGDCKWRWLVCDIDRAASEADPTETDFWEFKIICDNRFYWALRESEHFRKQFVITAMDMMNTNFSLENVEEVLSEWGLDLSYANGYFVKRPEYMIESLRKEFNLYGTVEVVSLDINDTEAGKVYINTTEADVSNGTWTGQYFTDYPVDITAVANPGYRFVGWSGSYEIAEESIQVGVVEGGISLTAVFEKE